MRIIPFLIVLSATFSCSALTSYQSEISTPLDYYHSGNAQDAATEMSAIADDEAESNSTVIFHLEASTMLRDAGNYQASFEYLERAEQIIKSGYDERGRMMAAANQAVDGGMLSQKGMAYTGYVHDRVMLNTYKALNMLSLNKLDDALVEARRINQAQVRGISELNYDIQESRQDSSSSLADSSLSFMDAISLDGFSTKSSSQPSSAVYSSFGRFPANQNYDNDFSTFVVGLLRRISGGGENPEWDFKRLHDSHPDSVAIAGELAAIRAGNRADGWGYVIFENGIAPYREEVEFAIPVGYLKALFSNSSKVSDVYSLTYLSLPRIMNGVPATNAGLVLSAENGLLMNTEIMTDMTDLVEFEFEERFSSILLRELVSTVLKSIAIDAGGDVIEKAVGEGMDENEQLALGFFAGILKSWTSSALSQADDRSWRSGAARFEVARFPLEGIEGLSLALGDNPQVGAQVTIPQGCKNVVVMVRSISPDHVMTAHVVGIK